MNCKVAYLLFAFYTYTLGTDYRFSSSLLVGILAQVDWSDENNDAADVAASGSSDDLEAYGGDLTIRIPLH